MMEDDLEQIHNEYLRLLTRCNHLKAKGDSVNHKICATAADDLYALLLSETAKRGMAS